MLLLLLPADHVFADVGPMFPSTEASILMLFLILPADNVFCWCCLCLFLPMLLLFLLMLLLAFFLMMISSVSVDFAFISFRWCYIADVYFYHSVEFAPVSFFKRLRADARTAWSISCLPSDFHPQFVSGGNKDDHSFIVDQHLPPSYGRTPVRKMLLTIR